MLGSETLYKVNIGQDFVMVKSLDDSFRQDEQIYLAVSADDMCFFGQDEQRIRDLEGYNIQQYLTAAGGGIK